MEKTDFKVSTDTIFFACIGVACLFSFLSYKLGFDIGYDRGIKTEKIGWLEDQDNIRLWNKILERVVRWLDKRKEET